MIAYREFRPTGFDHSGLGLPDRQDWLVAPCSQTRDSGLAEQSNWSCQAKVLEEADPDGTDHETHSFGHWACGHFELVLVRPGSQAATEAKSLESALAYYPLLDDNDHSQREYDAQLEAIEFVGRQLVFDDAPEDWVSQCWSWLWKNDQSALEGVELTYPSSDSVSAALRALEFASPDD